MLLLAIALPPMVLVAIFYHVSTTDLGNELAAKTQEVLVDDAYRLLHRIVDDYGQLLNRSQQTLELAVGIQATEVECRMACQRNSSDPIFVTNETTRSENFQQGLVLSDKHMQVGSDGSSVPLPVNFSTQVFCLAPNANRNLSTRYMEQLADMTKAYRALYSKVPQLAIWQYTGLESGMISNYPGVEAFPRDFDPRKRPWYQSAKKTGMLSWGEPYVDALSGGIILTVSQPVYHADGSFAGVTSIDFPFDAILGAVKLPADWAKKARILSVARDESEDNQTKLKIIAQKSYQSLRQPWQSPVKMDFLRSDNPTELAALVRDAEAGRAGVRRMGYDHVDSFWAYGEVGLGKSFPVIIVPYDFIVSQAAETKARVLETTNKPLHLTAAILIAVVMAVTVLAFWVSRSISLPIRHLAEAAVDLANGDFQAKVDIKSGGELKMLGDVFNAMGPRLKEREHMLTSLALAKEVQQCLLPLKTPESRWLEIVASCSFSEEVGGDYYDFVNLTEVDGPSRLGIAVGDVSGHGLGAALLMATVRGGIHCLVRDQLDDLGGIFRLLNKNFLSSSGFEQFMTLFLAVLDEADRTFRWVSAGHGPCFWMHRETRGIVELETTGIPLGILDNAEYDPAEPIHLSSGDMLILGTDGLWEAQNPVGEMYGTARLIEQLESCWDQSAHEIQSTILTSIAAFCDSFPQGDDITLVIVKAT